MAISALTSYWKISKSRVKLSVYRGWLLVLIAYLLSIILLLSPTLGIWARLTYFRGIGLCMTDFRPSISINKTIFIFGIIIPLLTLTVIVVGYCYYKIYRIVHFSNRIINDYHRQIHSSSKFGQGGRNARSFSRAIDLAKTLAIIFGLFIVSYTPYALANVFQYFNWIRLTLTQGLYLLIVSCSNSIFNPVILYSRRQKYIQNGKNKFNISKRIKVSSVFPLPTNEAGRS